jgi:hypothetical protein
LSLYSLDALDLNKSSARLYRCEDHGPDRVSGGRQNATDLLSPAMVLPYIWLEAAALDAHRYHS